MRGAARAGRLDDFCVRRGHGDGGGPIAIPISLVPLARFSGDRWIRCLRNRYKDTP